MGSVRKIQRQKGIVYEASVMVQNRRKSKTFRKASDAKRWISEIETDMYKNPDDIKSTDFADILKKYRDTVTPQKKGWRRETLFINSFLKRDIARLKTDRIKSSDIRMYIDERLKEVSNSTVNRELCVLSAIFSKTVNEWCLLRKNPMKGIKKPKKPPARTRVPTEQELNQIYSSLNYIPYSIPCQKKQIIGACVLFATLTAMRAGEILGLKWENVNERSVFLSDTKNGESRTVPLSKNAVKVIESVRGFNKPFDVKSQTLDVMFRRYVKKCDIVDLHFHDMRRYALSNMAKKIKNPMDLAKISGHKDLKILLNTYYKISSDDLADMLD